MEKGLFYPEFFIKVGDETMEVFGRDSDDEPDRVVQVRGKGLDHILPRVESALGGPVERGKLLPVARELGLRLVCYALLVDKIRCAGGIENAAEWTVSVNDIEIGWWLSWINRPDARERTIRGLRILIGVVK